MPSSARGASPDTPRSKKISTEDAEKLYQRLYADTIVHKKAALERLDQKYYPVAKADQCKRQTEEQANEMIERLAVKEVEIRKKRQQDAEKLASKGAGGGGKEGAAGKTLSETEVEESVRRLYNDSVRIRDETHKRLEKKFCFHNASVEAGKAKTHSKEELAEAARRLAVPTKKDFSADEINKIYGFKETPRGKKWTPHGLIDPAGAGNEEE